MHEYDLIADWYALERIHPTGVPEVQALTEELPRGASVLDIGCGNGIPLTQLLVNAGFHVVGVDSSSKMLEKFRANLPHTPALYGTIQSCDLGGRVFDAAISWGMLFHLTPGEQARTFAKLADALKPGGLFLFTAGDKDGEIEGAMNGVVFHYFSFSVEGYRGLLDEHRFTLIDTHADAGQNTYYLARRRT
jgi:SAM-dependent methyltransferase